MPLEFFLIIALVGVNAGVSLLGFRAFRGDSGNSEDFLFIPFQVHRGQNIKGMLVSSFAHADWLHLIINMYVFFMISQDLLMSRMVNAVGYIMILLAAVFGANLVTYFVRKDDPHFRSLGASDMTSGLIFALIVFFPTIQIFFIPGVIFAILFLAVSYWLMKRGSYGISHEGHLGGAIGGFIAAAIVSDQHLDPLINWFTQWF